MGIESWDATAANNNSASPNGAPEGMAPSGVNDTIRQNMASIRSWFEDAQWINLGYTHAYASGTSFTIASTDYTSTYHTGRRIKAVGSSTGTIYGTITSSSYSSNTTVNVSWDSGSLQNESLTISLAALTKDNDSLPYLNKKAADVASASTINLDQIRGDLVDVTGTTAITAITLAEGQERVVRFTGALTLTHGASLALPTSANITTAAGDFAIFRGYASSVVRCVGYSKANGKALDASVSASDLPQATTSALGGSLLPSRITISNNGSDSDHDIDFSAGTMQFSGGDGQAAVSALIKQADATWASGTNAGGMASGISLSSNTWYYCFALSNSDGDTTDFGFDTSTTASNLLADSAVSAAGLTKYKYLGAIRTDGSSNIRSFRQSGNEFYYLNKTTNTYTASNPGTSQVTQTMLVPPRSGIVAQIMFKYGQVSNPSDRYGLLRSSLENNSTPSSTHHDIHLIVGAGGNFVVKYLPTDNSQVWFRVTASDANTKAGLNTISWIDNNIID